MLHQSAIGLSLIGSVVVAAAAAAATAALIGLLCHLGTRPDGQVTVVRCHNPLSDMIFVLVGITILDDNSQ